MSLTIDAATRLHELQLESAKRYQERVVAVVDWTSAAAQLVYMKLPTPPRAGEGRLAKVTGPVAKVVGTPAEAGSLYVRGARDWAERQSAYQDGLLEAAFGSSERARVVPVTAVK